MNTYINDKKLAEYPFYETGADAPPPGCIRYLGVCLKGTTASPVYASAITVGMDGVLVSLCRDPDEEIIGTVYATAAEGTVSMELSGSTVPGTASMLIDKTMLSTSYGTYTGKFYLDPSCVTYMQDTVAGNLKTVNVNGTTYAASQGINFTCMGSVVEFESGNITGSTVTETETVLIKGTTAVNSFALVASEQSAEELVDSINEIILPAAGTSYPMYPEFGIQSFDPAAIQIDVDNTRDKAVILTLNGTTAFPNCYRGKGDEA